MNKLSYEMIRKIISYIKLDIPYWYNKSDKFRKLYINIGYSNYKYSRISDYICYNDTTRHYKNIYYEGKHNMLIITMSKISILNNFINLVRLVLHLCSSITISGLNKLQILKIDKDSSDIILGNLPELRRLHSHSDSVNIINFISPKLKVLKGCIILLDKHTKNIEYLSIGYISYDLSKYPKLITLSLSKYNDLKIDIKGISRIQKLHLKINDENYSDIEDYDAITNIPNLVELYLHSKFPSDQTEETSITINKYSHIKYLHIMDNLIYVKNLGRFKSLERIYVTTDSPYIRIKEYSKYAKVYYENYNIPIENIDVWMPYENIQ